MLSIEKESVKSLLRAIIQPECGMMRKNPVNYAKGETPMTDLQFNAFVELQNKYVSLLQEVNVLRRAKPRSGDDGMTDYQFKRYEKLREKCEELTREVAILREENVKLQVRSEVLRGLTSDRK